MDSAQYYEPADSGLFEESVTVSINIFKNFDCTVQDSFRCWRKI